MPRRHDIDALRAIAFALLILYHLGMLYVAEWDWHVKSSYLSETLQLPMLTVNRWRMDLIFLISGISTAFLMTNISLREFAKKRAKQLIVPFVFGVMVIVPVQPYCQGVMNGLVEPGFWVFLGRYHVGKYMGYDWPPEAFNGWKNSFTWNHLWYLLNLIFYTALIIVLKKPLAWKAGLFVTRAFTDLRGARLLVWPSVVLLAYTMMLQMQNVELYKHAIYFSMFLVGFWMANDEPLWHELKRLRKVALLVTVVSYALYMWSRIGATDTSPLHTLIIIWIFRCIYIWAMLCSILGWGYHLLNRPFRWLPWANQAVYPWYILHQSVIIMLAYWLVPLKIGSIIEPIVVGGGTVLVCWFLTSVVIQRVNWLRLLFGLR